MTDIFQDGAPADQQGTVTPPSTAIQLPDEVAALVGEGKKYATPEAALKALPHAQQHIATLEAELAALREKAQGAHNVDELYEAVQELQKQRGTPAAATVSEDAIASVLDRQLEKRQAEQLAAANVAAVKDALGKKYGDKAKEQFAAKAAELGLTVEALSDVARKSATAALTLFGLTAGPARSPAPVIGSTNTAALHSQQQPETKHKPVMFGAKTSDVVEAWRAAAPKTE